MTGRHRRSIYVEDAIFAELERTAVVNGRSTNAEICFALRAYVGAPAEPEAKPLNPQAEELVAQLRRCVIGNGRPEHLVSSAGWYDPARLLLERDRRDFAEARLLIDWSQRDTFWRANILSMDTFRRQYDRLRLQRARTRPAAVNGNGKASDGGVKFQAGWLARRFPRADPGLVERLVGEHYAEHGSVPVAEELAARLAVA